MPRLPFLRQEGAVNVQGIGSIPQVRLERRLGSLPEATMKEVRRALVFLLELENS